MKNFIFKGWALLIAIAILAVSCSKDYLGEKPPLYNAPDYSQNELILDEYFTFATNHVVENGADFTELVKAINKYSVKKSGEKMIDEAEAEAIKNQAEEYKFASNDGSLEALFMILESEGKLTSNESKELIALDKLMNQEISLSDGIQILESFESKIMESATLTNEEKDRLLFFKSGIVTYFNVLITQFENNGTVKQGCIECLLAKKWSIGGLGFVIALAGVGVCTIATGGTLSIPCVLAGLAYWTTAIYLHCPQCFGAEVQDPGGDPEIELCEDCPTHYSYDGANCYLTYFPSGTHGFIYGNAFYYSPQLSGTQCPHQPFNESGFDGVSCLVKWGIPSEAVPFIFGNAFYVRPLCP